MSSISYTTTLEVRREIVEALAELLARRREVVGTWSLGPFRQAVLVIWRPMRWSAL